mmetsp:Transcript_6917/g.22260  ORF Transcript_6917/g.22260 Transcript_6917/m.22260 type:complete len:152 (-) Transcript_6917:144-599(-)
MRRWCSAQVSRVGGKGGIRRKKKVTHKSAAQDDKKLQSSLRRMGVNPVNAVSEVLMLMEDDTAMVFNQGVRMQANLSANTYIVSGTHTVKPLSEVNTGSLGMDQAQLAQLQAMMAQHQAMQKAKEESGEAANDDDDVPDLVENFEEVSESS